MKKVTIITPCHNTDTELFRKTAQSVAGQELSADQWEWLIVFHNCSSPYLKEAEAMLASFHDIDIHTVRLEDGSGSPSSPRNYGISLATGEFLYFLDADDLLHPEFLSEALKHIEKTASDLLIAGADNAVTQKNIMPLPMPLLIYSDTGSYEIDNAAARYPENEKTGAAVKRRNSEILGRLIYGAPMFLSAKLIRRSLIADNGICFDTDLLITEDVLFEARLIAAASKISVLTDVSSYTYIQSEGSQLQKLVCRESFTPEMFMTPLERIIHFCEAEDIDYNLFLWSMFEMLGAITLNASLSAEYHRQLTQLMLPYAQRLKKIPYLGPAGEKSAVSMKTYAAIFMDTGVYEQTDLSLTVIDLVENMRQYSGPAITMSDASITFEELHRRSDAVAACIMQKYPDGVKCIAIHMKKGIPFYVVLYAVIKSGNPFVVLSKTNTEERKEYIKRDIGAEFVIYDEDYDSLLTEGFKYRYERRHVKSTDDFMYVYTSGSEGKPKGIRFSHLNIVNINLLLKGNTKNLLQAYHCNTYVMAMEPDFLFGLLVSFEAGFYGKNLCIMKDAGEIKSDFFRKIFENPDNSINLTVVPSATLGWFADRETAAYISGFKIMLYGGEALRKEQLATAYKYLRPGSMIFHGYATTETGPATYLPVSPEHLTSGPAQADLVISILDDNLNPVLEGEKGRICLTGYRVSQGYVSQSDSQNFVISGDHCNTFLSGDEGYLDEAGELHVCGRTDRMLKVRGVRVEPTEIENAIMSHPHISNAAVWAESSEEGNKIYAFYVADRETDQQALREYLAGKIPFYMLPDIFVQTESLPLTQRGKLDYKALISMYRSRKEAPKREVPGGREAFAGEAEKLACRAFEKILGIHGIAGDDNFFENGGSSYKVILLSEALAKEGYAIGAADLYIYPTPAALARVMKRIDPAEMHTEGRLQSGDKKNGDADIVSDDELKEQLKDQFLKSAEGERIRLDRGSGYEDADRESIEAAYPVDGTIRGYYEMPPQYREAYRYPLRIQFKTAIKADGEYLKKRMELLSRRHPVLRSFFAYAGDPRRPALYQIIKNKKDIRTDFYDASAEAPEKLPEIIEKAWNEMDEQNEFISVRSIREPDGNYTVLFRVVHMIADALGSNILLSELIEEIPENEAGAAEDSFHRSRLDILRRKQNTASEIAYFREYLKDAKIAALMPPGGVVPEGTEIIVDKVILDSRQFENCSRYCGRKMLSVNNYLQFLFGRALLAALHEKALIFICLFSGRHEGNARTADNYFTQLPVCIREDMNALDFHRQMMELSKYYYLNSDEIGRQLRLPFRILGCADGLNSNLMDSVLEGEKTGDAKQVVKERLRGTRVYRDQEDTVIEISHYSHPRFDGIYEALLTALRNIIKTEETFW